MTAIVIDASIGLTWCFKDETSPETEALFAQVERDTAVVPALWHLELANVLLQAERRGRIPNGQTQVRLSLVADLPIETDTEMAGRAWREILSLARSENLTLYDAAYLELAMRRRLPLATKDAELRDAANRLGVSVLP